MNEALTKQLIRQLKIMNFWISFFGVLIVLTLCVTGYLLWRVVSFTRDVQAQVTEIRTSIDEQLDVKEKFCSSDSVVSGVVSDVTGICKE